MSLNIDAQDIGKIIGVNAAFDPRFTQDENVQEILDFSKEATDFRIKSAVTANLILKELDCNDVIIKVLELTAEYANRYRTINRYENILKNIISYSHVNTFLLKSGQKEKFLVNYYDSLKELEYYRENTFFGFSMRLLVRISESMIWHNVFWKLHIVSFTILNIQFHFR